MHELTGEFIQVEDVEEEPFDNDLILLSPVTQQVLSLNQSAAVLWEALRRWISAEELVQLMLEAFPDRSNKEVTTEVNTLLETLCTAGLIMPSSSCPY